MLELKWNKKNKVFRIMDLTQNVHIILPCESIGKRGEITMSGRYIGSVLAGEYEVVE